MPENPIHRKSPDDPIQDELTRRLVQHLAGLEPGTRLPSERTLAEKLGTSRTSLRDRLGRLEATGVIERRTGSGTYVGRLSSNAFGQSLMMSIEASSVDAITMLPVRHAIEREAARLAAGRRDHRANAEMAIALDEMAASDRPEDLQHADVAFHKALMASSGATGLIFFSTVLGEVLWGTIVQVRPYEDREHLWRIHNAILACIIAQQPAEAMAAVDAHFDWLAAITAPGATDDEQQDAPRQQE